MNVVWYLARVRAPCLAPPVDTSCELHNCQTQCHHLPHQCICVAHQCVAQCYCGRCHTHTHTHAQASTARLTRGEGEATATRRHSISFILDICKGSACWHALLMQGSIEPASIPDSLSSLVGLNTNTTESDTTRRRLLSSDVTRMSHTDTAHVSHSLSEANAGWETMCDGIVCLPHVDNPSAQDLTLGEGVSLRNLLQATKEPRTVGAALPSRTPTCTCPHATMLQQIG